MDFKETLEKKCNILNMQMKSIVDKDNSAAGCFTSLINSSSAEPFSPVRRVEDMLGIYGIYEKYNFPDNMKPEEFEKLMQPAIIFQFDGERNVGGESKRTLEMLAPLKEKSFKHIKFLYDKLVELNPKLKEVKIDNSKIYDHIAVISGACSGFPFDDIKMFCENISSKDKKDLDKDRDTYSKEIADTVKSKGIPSNSRNSQMMKERLDSGDIFKNWCPTKETFNKVKEKVETNYREEAQRKAYEFMMSRSFDD